VHRNQRERLESGLSVPLGKHPIARAIYAISLWSMRDCQTKELADQSLGSGQTRGSACKSAVRIMKDGNTLVVIAVAILIAGCGKKSSDTPVTAAPTPTSVALSSSIALSALTAWQRGDKAAAINNFVETNWSFHPLFPTASALSLSEDQFKRLSAADREIKSQEAMSQIAALKQLAQAVAQAGRDAGSKGDPKKAQKHFASLRQCGIELQSPTSLKVLQLVGKSIEKMSEAELANVGH
jgi:hypothetical protein